MIGRIIDWCAANRFLVFTGTIVLTLWGIWSSAASRIDVTVPGRRGRRRPGVVLHRVAALQADDRAIREGIPVTAVARTLLDLAELLSLEHLQRACEKAGHGAAR